jgi:hypothetical protein
VYSRSLGAGDLISDSSDDHNNRTCSNRKCIRALTTQTEKDIIQILHDFLTARYSNVVEQDVHDIYEVAMKDISSDYVAKIGSTQLQLSQMTQHFSPRQSFSATQRAQMTHRQ